MDNAKTPDHLESQPANSEVPEEIIDGEAEGEELAPEKPTSVPIGTMVAEKKKRQEAEKRTADLERQVAGLTNERDLAKMVLPEVVEDEALVLPNPDDYIDNDEWVKATEEYNQKYTERLQKQTQDAINQAMAQNAKQAEVSIAQEQQQAAYVEAETAHHARADALGAEDFIEREERLKDWIGDELYSRVIKNYPNSEQVVYVLGSEDGESKVLELLKEFEIDPWGGVTKLNAFAGQLDPIKKSGEELPEPDEPIKGGAGGVVPQGAIDKKIAESREQRRLGKKSMTEHLTYVRKLEGVA